MSNPLADWLTLAVDGKQWNALSTIENFDAMNEHTSKENLSFFEVGKFVDVTPITDLDFPYRVPSFDCPKCGCNGRPAYHRKIPTGFRPPAQGCEERATLGQMSNQSTTPTGLCQPS